MEPFLVLLQGFPVAKPSQLICCLCLLENPWRQHTSSLVGSQSQWMLEGTQQDHGAQLLALPRHKRIRISEKYEFVKEIQSLPPLPEGCDVWDRSCEEQLCLVGILEPLPQRSLQSAQ